jgi:hypothetical protein
MVDVLTHLQLVEGAANLSAMGFEVDPCNTDATFTAKTRSSSSWTADLMPGRRVPGLGRRPLRLAQPFVPVDGECMWPDRG